VLLGASRRNMPAYGLDPAIYGPIEDRCRSGLGADRLQQLDMQGAALTHDELVDLISDRSGT
jgi:hypothetical protein